MLSVDTKLKETNTTTKNKSSPIPINQSNIVPIRRVSSEAFNPNFSSSPPENSFMAKLEKRFKSINEYN